MNIFVVHNDPVIAATMLCDQHTVAMVKESAQMLCNPFWEMTSIEPPYKRTHYNHPCSKWARASSENYNWLISHGFALAEEHFYRFDKDEYHKSRAVIEWCHKNQRILQLPAIGLTPFAVAIKEEHQEACVVEGDPIASYRNFYNKVKCDFARWNKKRKPPVWYSPIK